MLSTMLLRCVVVVRRHARTGLWLASALLLSGCMTPVMRHPGPPPVTSGDFTMSDGLAIPYRSWLPEGQPKAIVLALHGMNDSRDAWEYPAPAFTQAGIAIYSPDQRGFGATSTRGHWPSTQALVDDARTEARILRHRYPRTRLILMAESMGAAVLMVLASEPDPPPVDGYVLIAPAVWSRSEMSFPVRALLWLADEFAPGLLVTGGGFVKVTASDNREALIRLTEDPLTIHETRVSAVKGLVDLMDKAHAAAPHMPAPSLFLYGGHDELIPPRATAATWRALPADVQRAFYPDGYHLMLRDKDRAVPIADILAWIADPHAPLPSGADARAAAWLKAQEAKQR
ncbi:MAG TPA: alpha/beta fold hydrolase [Rhodopila sp.]|uniref:alpha/beta fold hydrolase n=1 Tax=Rhodopila sp. TaxID=2480087 RepID=UPI002CDCB152|nr:alpha/beta fold hydrolase [Rhodopila sp.]HVY18099.1 alpha/beta fold hydrolase [Rhodopila sp.]